MDPKLTEMYPAIYMAMIETADIVAQRYNVCREYQDEYSFTSQMRMAAAQENGLFDDEIVPMATKMKLVERETKEESIVDYVVDGDECNRPTTTLEGLAKLAARARRGQFHHRRQRQPAVRRRRRRGAHVRRGSRSPQHRTDGRLQGAGPWPAASPTRWASARSIAVPKLLARHGLTVDDIDLWELNEAFASQCLYCRDTLGIDPEKYNVNGGSIADRPPLRHDRHPVRRPHPAGGQASRRQVGRRHDVHRRRPGRRRPLRDLLITRPNRSGRGDRVGTRSTCRYGAPG